MPPMVPVIGSIALDRSDNAPDTISRLISIWAIGK